MKFETLLARRYISAQKRHAALTVCSIIIAVALITMLCSCFTTLRGIQRAASYDAQPYHVMFNKVTKNQGAAIANMNQVASCELKPNPDGVTYQAQILFGEYIDDHWTYLDNMIRELKLNASGDPYDGLELNAELMKYDLVTLSSRYEAVQILALFFVFLIFFALALRMVIDTAFEVSSKERERQFGVLQSVGATPQQIVRILTAEGMILSAVGVPLGIGIGLLFGFGAYKAVLSSGVAEAFFTADKAEQLVHFHINPWLTISGGVIGLFWVFFSAYGTGMRIIKKTPVQAITARSNTVKKVRKHTFLSLFFGWTGKIASRSARRQPKRFAVTVLSLTISLTLFASISSVFHAAEDITTEALATYDWFGRSMADFELILDMSDADRIDESPTAFTEGLKQLEDTGYFTNIEHYIMEQAHLEMAEENEEVIYIGYVNRAIYERMFGGNPEISYDALTKTGGGILMNVDESLVPSDTETVSLRIHTKRLITKDEYDRLQEEPEEERLLRRPVKISPGGEDGSTTETLYYFLDSEYADFTVVSRFMQQAVDSSAVSWTPETMLIFTEDEWLSGDWELYGDFSLPGLLMCQLANDSDYEAAKHFLIENSERYGYDPDDPWADNYAVSKKFRTVLAAVRIGVTAVLLMIALIAIVNMVNIVSTGILNRKQELAAMQCLGMTKGQMYRMVIIECLQFTLWAAVAATILCTLLIYGTEQFMISLDLAEIAEEKLISYSEPIVKVWLASIAAFLCALASSLLPLRQMQREPLVEQIRAVE